MLDGSFGLEQLALLCDVRWLEGGIYQHFAGLLLGFFGSRHIPCKFIILFRLLTLGHFCDHHLLFFLQLKCLRIQRGAFRNHFLYFLTDLFLNLLVPLLQQFYRVLHHYFLFLAVAFRQNTVFYLLRLIYSDHSVIKTNTK